MGGVVSVVLPAVVSGLVHIFSKKPKPAPAAVVAKKEGIPRPAWLREDKYNFAITGQNNTGKSSVINRVLDKEDPDSPETAQSDGSAMVDQGETTLANAQTGEPKSYHAVNAPKAIVYDLPGAGTDAYPNSTYLEKFGIRYMNAIAIVMDGGEPESQMLILKEAHKHNVPVFVVKNKVDLILKAKMKIKDPKLGRKPTKTEALHGIRETLARRVSSMSLPTNNLYLVCAEEGAQETFELPQLLQDVLIMLEDQQK